MPFTQIDVNSEIKKRCADSPKFKKAWEDNQAEYRLIGEMIALRKQKKLTQSELAFLTGNKQQVISRIERRENIPSIKIFSNILDALGYELPPNQVILSYTGLEVYTK
jgi:DNA-binding XRE family transcriptional regulator